MPQNFGRRYRIKIGIPEIEKIYWVYECSIQANSTYSNFGGISLAFNNDNQLNIRTPYKAGTSLSQTIPSDAYLISNMPEDGNSLRGFNFTFSTKRVMSSAPNKSEVSTLVIQNLPPEIIELLNKEGCLVEISAAYKSKKDLDLYYIGTVQRLDIRRSGPNLGYVITMKDNGLPVKKTQVSLDFSDKDSIADVVASLSKLMGLSNSNLALEGLKQKYITGGLSLEGNVSDILSKMAKRYKFDYSFFNGKFAARMRNILASDSNYNILARNTWTFLPEDNNIIEIDDISERGKESGGGEKKKKVRVITFLTPASIDEFFTIPPEISNKHAGTYKITELSFEISSEQGFNTIFVGEEM